MKNRKTRCVAELIVAFVFIYAELVFPMPIEFPDTPAGKRAGEVVDLMNQGDVKAAEDYIQSYYAPSFRDAFPMARHVNFYKMTASMFGHLTLKQIAESSDSNIKAILRASSDGAWIHLELQVEPEDPHRVLTMGAVVGGPPEGLSDDTDAAPSANAGNIKPVTVGQPMPDFTLPTYQGEDITISQLKGKSIMLIFPRGKFEPDVWCRMCAYQYADLAEIEKEKQIRKKHNLEILFVLPYSKEMVEDWVDKFPKKFAEIEEWKNPPNANKLTGGRKAWMEETRRVFPKKFEGKIPMPFPILIDAGAKVSKGLRLFTPNWNNGRGPMNIPAVFIIDKNGILQFKYLSQVTFDRPGFDYLSKVLPCVDYWGRSN